MFKSKLHQLVNSLRMVAFWLVLHMVLRLIPCDDPEGARFLVTIRAFLVDSLERDRA